MKPKLIEPYKHILNILDCPYLACTLNNYQEPLTLLEMLQAINSAYFLDREQFKDEKEFETYSSVLEKNKQSLIKIFNSPAQLVLMQAGLKEIGLKYGMRKLATFSQLSDLRDILKDEETFQAIQAERGKLSKGQLLDCFSVITPDHFLYRADGMFLYSKTASLIRSSLGYSYYSIPDLTTIGFILDDEYTELKLIINLTTGEKFISTEKRIEVQDINNPTPITKFDKRWGMFAEKRTQGMILKRILFRKIVGICPEVHSKAIQEYNEKQREKVAIAHSVQHKKHKERSDAQRYFDEEFNFVTVREYAQRYGLNRTTASSRLRRWSKYVLEDQNEGNMYEQLMRNSF